MGAASYLMHRKWHSKLVKLAHKFLIEILTAIGPPLPGKLSVSGSSSLDGSKPCFSTHWRATSTRFPLLPLVPSFAAISALLPITIYGTGRPPGPPDPRGAENVPVAAISAAHFCRLVFVLLCERSWTKITPANEVQTRTQYLNIRQPTFEICIYCWGFIN